VFEDAHIRRFFTPLHQRQHAIGLHGLVAKWLIFFEVGEDVFDKRLNILCKHIDVVGLFSDKDFFTRAMYYLMYAI